jgi:hypothetical protein
LRFSAVNPSVASSPSPSEAGRNAFKKPKNAKSATSKPHLRDGAVVKSRAVAEKIEESCSDQSESDDEKPLHAVKNITTKASVKPKKAPVKAKATAKMPKVTPKNATKSPIASAQKPEIVPLKHEDTSEGSAADVSSDDEDDRPFSVEYSPSGRATCRSCDEIILKGVVRVSHVPLFRGKPGYRVYRHLDCSIFSEDIHTAQDVGGWKKLKKEDLEALVLQVEESKLLIEKENDELEPDELVQTEFEGETRNSPPGLDGVNLLPFQVEGVSWMYHQEVHVDEIRGGILANEMGE